MEGTWEVNAPKNIDTSDLGSGPKLLSWIFSRASTAQIVTYLDEVFWDKTDQPCAVAHMLNDRHFSSQIWVDGKQLNQRGNGIPLKIHFLKVDDILRTLRTH